MLPYLKALILVRNLDHIPDFESPEKFLRTLFADNFGPVNF